MDEEYDYGSSNFQTDGTMGGGLDGEEFGPSLPPGYEGSDVTSYDPAEAARQEELGRQIVSGSQQEALGRQIVGDSQQEYFGRDIVSRSLASLPTNKTKGGSMGQIADSLGSYFKVFSSVPATQSPRRLYTSRPPSSVANGWTQPWVYPNRTGPTNMGSMIDGFLGGNGPMIRPASSFTGNLTQTETLGIVALIGLGIVAVVNRRALGLA